MRHKLSIIYLSINIHVRLFISQKCSSYSHCINLSRKIWDASFNITESNASIVCWLCIHYVVMWLFQNRVQVWEIVFLFHLVIKICVWQMHSTCVMCGVGDSLQ